MDHLRGMRISSACKRLWAVAACLLATACLAMPAVAAGSSKKLTPEQEEFRKTLTPQDRALLEGREMTPEERQQMNPYDAIRAKLDERDRREYYRPAPPDFKPEDVARKLKLTLVPESRMLRKGKPFRYRVEVQNVGNKPVYFSEYKSFIKTGKIEFERWAKYKFYMTDPDGHKRVIEPSLTYRASSPPGSDWVSKPMTREEADKFEKVLALQTFEEMEGFNLSMNLQPGDALVSKAYYSKEIAGFRDLGINGVDYKLDKPGTYRFQVVYDDPPPKHPKEAWRQNVEDLKRSVELTRGAIAETRTMSLKNDPFGRDEHWRKEYLRGLMQDLPKEQAQLKAELRRKISQKEIEGYEKERRGAWGRIESNVVEIEVIP